MLNVCVRCVATSRRGLRSSLLLVGEVAQRWVIKAWSSHPWSEVIEVVRDETRKEGVSLNSVGSARSRRSRRVASRRWREEGRRWLAVQGGERRRRWNPLGFLFFFFLFFLFLFSFVFYAFFLLAIYDLINRFPSFLFLFFFNLKFKIIPFSLSSKGKLNSIFN